MFSLVVDDIFIILFAVFIVSSAVLFLFAVSLLHYEMSFYRRLILFFSQLKISSPFYNYSVFVLVENSPPSILALLHSNVTLKSMEAILMLNKRKKKNNDFISSLNNNIVGHPNNESLRKLLLSSSFSSNDAHSLPRELQQVNPSNRNVVVIFLKYFPIYDCNALVFHFLFFQVMI